MNAVNVFIGYDPRQPVAFHTLAHSIWSKASVPVSITRLQLSQLPLTRTGLTEFTYSRFLVPYISNYEGTSIFVDSDFVCREDIAELLVYPIAFPEHAVFVSKNKLAFEWASLMVFNNAQCRILTPEFVEDPSNSCFDFTWASSVGDLPQTWNHLVGYDEPNPDAKMVHYTQGVPCWPETKDCEHADTWMGVAKNVMRTVSFKELMGRSVHAKRVYARLQKQQTTV